MSQFDLMTNGIAFPLLVALFAGVVLGAATFTPWLWPVAPLSFSILLYLIFNSSRASAVWVGQCFGVGLMGAAFFWGFDTLPLNWLGIVDPILSFFIMLGVWGFYSLIIALPVAVWAYLMHVNGSNAWLLLTAPFVWGIGEFAHAFVHSLSTWGSGSTFGVDLSFGFVGYALSWSSYLWLARLGGVTALSFAVALFGTALYFLWSRLSASPAQRAAVCGAALLSIVGVGMLVPSPVEVVYEPDVVEVHGVRIALVTTYFPPVLSRTDEELTAVRSLLVDEIFAALEKDPDVIVLPEYARFLKSESLFPKETSRRIREALVAGDIVLVDSERRDQDLFGVISFFDGRQVVEQQQKRLLIPLGEYQPYLLIAAFKLFGLEKEAGAILKYRTYKPSRHPFASRLFMWKDVTLSVLACSEVFSPFGYREASNAGADVLVNIASHSWVRDSSNILFRETMAMARVHATYTGKLYLQATNFAPSYAVYPAPRVSLRSVLTPSFFDD